MAAGTTRARDRRDVIKGAIAVAAGAAAATLTSARPAAATDGEYLRFGYLNTNQSESTTTWSASHSGWVLHLVGSYGLHASAEGAGAVHAISGATTGSGGNGVTGYASASSGFGVYGQADDATGVGTLGRADAGTGLKGWTQDGTAILAQADLPGGTALNVKGPAKFSRSGRATVQAGQASVTVSSKVIAASTMVLAMLQQRRAGVWVTAAVPDAGADTFTIHLNEPVGTNTRVAWFLLG